MSHQLIVLALCGVVTAGCSRARPSAETASSSAETTSEGELPGSDRDEHGCIPSAGYRWCERTQQCERPWELAKREDFDSTAEQFEDWCDGRE